jgi:hypothetical protein
VRDTAALLLASSAVVVIAIGAVSGCGAGRGSTPAELKLQREDLIAVVRALRSSEAPVGREVADAKAAWPLVANGLPTNISPSVRPPIVAASESAAKIELPAPLQEEQAATLTGPASQLAGMFRTFTRLATRGWTLIDAMVGQIERGSATSARFARANVALYIESVYDSHFNLAQIDKRLRAGYRKLGGASAFGEALTQSELDGVADFYSEATSRLHPHVGVRLGS